MNEEDFCEDTRQDCSNQVVAEHVLQIPDFTSTEPQGQAPHRILPGPESETIPDGNYIPRLLPYDERWFENKKKEQEEKKQREKRKKKKEIYEVGSDSTDSDEEAARQSPFGDGGGRQQVQCAQQ
mmetsp:Transcript_24133/g.58333  ORF Transcript_24133/g.58333 Transcript_24133/m.58333 type:complete len:125 (-) Transcript_24133:627-1001(-)